MYFSLVKMHSHRLSIEPNLTISPGEIGSYRQSINLADCSYQPVFPGSFLLCVTSNVGLPGAIFFGLSYICISIYVFNIFTCPYLPLE